MVRDGYYYGFAFIAVAILMGWMLSPPWAIIPLALAAFFLWFFRDPERDIPAAAGAIVSPADGKVTAIAPVTMNGANLTRISIFLNVFNVHVNRSPIAGTVREVRYQKGKYLNAMNPASADENEHTIAVVEGEGQTVTFKLIAGLLARRIVFNKKAGDQLARGERVGLIKFGSRVDIFLRSEANLQIKIGDHVKGGASVLAYVNHASQLASAGVMQDSQGVR
jgi:phosphatidylserine decarboxylase